MHIGSALSFVVQRSGRAHRHTSLFTLLLPLQVCLAYRNGEPKVVVVMSQQPKLEMEATFRRIIPNEQRFGTRFVFREGSAIIPDNLRMVAASQAAATIIVSDSSR